MRNLEWAIRLAVSVSLFALTACGGGGGGGTTASLGTGSGTTSSTPDTSGSTSSSGSSPPPTASIQDVPPAVIGSSFFVDAPHALPTADSATPKFNTSGYPNGTAFPLLQTSVDLSASRVTGISEDHGIIITPVGTQTVGGTTQQLFELKMLGEMVDAPNVPSDGTPIVLTDNRSVFLDVTNLDYSLYAAWGLSPITFGGSAIEVGTGVSGFQTPVSAVPTSGSASYMGNSSTGPTSGGASAVLFYSPDTTTISTAAVDGNASINVSFSTHAVSGSLTSMTATPQGGTAVPWNDVQLSGTLSGASLSGTTSTSSTPPGTTSFSSGSAGVFSGALFGPNAEELGATWSLHDSTGVGKTAMGFIGTTKQ